MRTYHRGASSRDDDETLKSILAKHPDLLERRGSIRGSISTRCSEGESASQLELAGTTPSRITKRRGTLGCSSSSSLLAPPICSPRRRSSVSETFRVVKGEEGVPTSLETRTVFASESHSRVRRSSVVTFVSESCDAIPGECVQEARPSTHIIPVFDTSSLERMVTSYWRSDYVLCLSSSFTSEQEYRDNRRNSVLSIISDGDESAGPSSSLQSTVPSVPVRRGSLFSVDPTEILGMARTPCFATSPRDVELFKNGGTPKIPRHLVTPHSGKSYSELQRPTPKSPNPTSPTPPAADTSWDMSNLTKSEAAEMLQSLLEATSVGVDPDSRDLANVLIGQLIRAHPDLVAPLGGASR
ncbi:hypothetical protein FOL47_001015 [Perkinsus chesapeaki]|uniref:Uncharacterized protein n=1 Tax=Perkinsus chesapeaki TaxID=330153 RepID=A0A7J6MKJ8_PERCH|nr:hypothetical protein FOL47_001015 [Perkinsus chesapeaki]